MILKHKLAICDNPTDRHHRKGHTRLTGRNPRVSSDERKGWSRIVGGNHEDKFTLECSCEKQVPAGVDPTVRYDPTLPETLCMLLVHGLGRCLEPEEHRKWKKYGIPMVNADGWASVSNKCKEAKSFRLRCGCRNSFPDGVDVDEDGQFIEV
jgi:hypothetical protein